jgi:hypothetical protein
MRSSDSSPPSDSESTKSSSSSRSWTYCLEAYINWSNRLSSFVTTEIIKHLKRHIRVKLLNYFIDAALECFNTGNFNSMMGILGKIIHILRTDSISLENDIEENYSIIECDVSKKEQDICKFRETKKIDFGCK